MARLKLPSAKNIGFLRSILDTVDFMLETDLEINQDVRSSNAVVIEARRQKYTIALCCADTELDTGEIMTSATIARSGFDTNIAANALVAAAYLGDVAFIEKLVERGVDLNKRQIWFTTPFEQACAQGHADAVRLLLEEGADFTGLEYPLRNAPLGAKYAAAHEKIIQVFLDHISGLCMELQTDYSHMGSQTSVMDERLNVIKQLLSETENYMHEIRIIDYETIKDKRQFFQMVYHGGEDALGWILQEGNDAFSPKNFCRQGDHRLLCRMIWQRRPDLLKMLIERGAPRRVEHMMEIVEFGDADLADLFLDSQGSSLDEYTILNGTEADQKAYFTLYEEVEGLYETIRGYIPLTFAVSLRNYDMVEWLVRRGAEIPSWVRQRALLDRMDSDERLSQILSIRAEIRADPGRSFVSGPANFLISAVFAVAYGLYYWCRFQDSRYSPPIM